MYDLFFFFKQKTAYEMSASLVGSEMCIREGLQGYLIALLFLGWGELAVYPIYVVEQT